MKSIPMESIIKKLDEKSINYHIINYDNLNEIITSNNTDKCIIVHMIKKSTNGWIHYSTEVDKDNMIHENKKRTYSKPYASSLSYQGESNNIEDIVDFLNK